MRYREAMSSMAQCRTIRESEVANAREKEFADGVAHAICFDFSRYPTAAQVHWIERIFRHVIDREQVMKEEQEFPLEP